MQKKGFRLLCGLLSATLLVSSLFTACGFSDDESAKEPQTYTIQYTDDAGTHTLSVEDGGLYSLESIPQKYGYEFTGLFDKEIGGKQYVGANGSALAAFEDDKNIVLFPQWKARKYTLVLDYQGAAVTDARQLAVNYGHVITDLPTNLELEHKEFTGWYTKENRGGEQVADQYGVLPLYTKITEKSYDLNDKDGYIYLYAGFKAAEYEVTLHFGQKQESIKVEYGTDVENIIYGTRIDGKAVRLWSKTANGSSNNAFTGKITEKVDLYAIEYAPALELNANGGDAIAPVVANAGETVALPTPTRENYKFIEWQTLDGTKYTATTMPQESVQLKAKWQAKLVFDENGGLDVDDISLAVGETVSYPTPEKEGYIFAGWYTQDKEKYELKQMPAESVVLKAGWYQEKSEIVTVVSSTVEDMIQYSDPRMYDSYTFDFSKRFNTGAEVIIKIHWHVKLGTTSSTTQTATVEFYSEKKVSSVYLMDTKKFSITDSYKDFEFDTTFTISDDFYICWYSTNQDWKSSYIKDFYYTLYYPDTETLYLY